MFPFWNISTSGSAGKAQFVSAFTISWVLGRLVVSNIKKFYISLFLFAEFYGGKKSAYACRRMLRKFVSTFSTW